MSGKQIFALFGMLLLTTAALVQTPEASANNGQQTISIPKGQLLPATQRLGGPRHRAVIAEDLIYQQDFEDTVSNLWTSGCWGVGMPSSGPYSGHSSYHCAATNLYGNYPDYASDSLWISDLTLPNLSGPSDQITLSYWEWFEMESGLDWGGVYVSTNGWSWTQLTTCTGSSDWRQTEIDLTSYAGQTIELMFYFHSDYSITYSGWYVDDIRITASIDQYFSATMQTLQEDNFFVYMNVAVDTNGVGLPSLNASNFTVREDGVLQTDYFNVIPPEYGGGVRLADIVFVVDRTGSMSEEIAGVRDNMTSFVNALAASGIDYGVGFVCFWDNVQVLNDYQFYHDDAEILSIISSFDAWGGEDEPECQLGAMAEGMVFNYRPGAQKIEIMITDATAHEGDWATPWTVDSLISYLVPADITVYPVFDTSVPMQQSQYIPIAEATNPLGTYFDKGDNFNEIISEIGESISNTYVVSYFSSNHNYNGIPRQVVVEVTYGAESDTASGSYVPGMAPMIQRTPSTLALHEQPWAEGTPLTIEAYISDYVEPYVTQAQVRYKNTAEPLSWTTLDMAWVSDSLYAATIPGYAVVYPGVDYYISATDGQSTVTDPSVQPNTYPYQLAILPNVAPEIVHTPIVILTPGYPVTITAEISDVTNSLASASLSYRKIGQLSYVKEDMTETAPNTYQGTIPAGYVTSDGYQYYLYAEDNFGVGSFHGTADAPHTVGGFSFTSLFFVSDPAYLLPVSFNIATDVDLRIGQAENVTGLQANIQYDPSKVEITKFEPGDFLEATGGTVTNLSSYNNTTGLLSVSLTAAGGTPPGVTGSGVVAAITFKARVADPTSDLVFVNSTLRDPLNVSLDHSTDDGAFETITDLLGDFNADMDVDFADYTLFVYYWNQVPDNPTGDIAGPIPGGGTPPLPPWSSTNYPYPGGNGVIDFEDQMVFTLMYNWWYTHAPSLMAVGSPFDAPPARIAGQLQASVEVPTAVDLGQQFALNLTLQNLKQVIGWHVMLEFDDAHLTYLGNNLDEILAESGAGICNFDHASPGFVDVSQVMLAHTGITSADPVAVEFYFEPKQSGNAFLRLQQLDLRDLRNANLCQNTSGLGENHAIAIAGALPSRHELMQNQPNPFNMATRLEFALPSDGWVSLKVYNLAGQEVATLINGSMQAGVHSLRFSADNLASGIYLYRISASDFTATKKMVLLK